MKREQHPEYIQTLRDRQTVARCVQAVRDWAADGRQIHVPAYGLSWTPASALGLVRELQALFRAYNRVLWDQFPYCRACGGQCCVNEASHVGPFDGVALALLGASLPDLPPDLSATDRACIYLAGRACSLPAEWRTLKCGSFFCLGGLWACSGTWNDAAGDRYHDLTAALQAVVSAHLPKALRAYERVRKDPLLDHLHDPADFAAALEDALWEVLVGPLHACYPLLDADAPDGSAAPGEDETREEKLLAFISEAMEQLLLDPPPAPEGMDLSPAQLLEDLETLEWIVLGRPAHSAQRLREMHARYAGAPAPTDGDRPSVWHTMRVHLAALF